MDKALQFLLDLDLEDCGDLMPYEKIPDEPGYIKPKIGEKAHDLPDAVVDGLIL